MQMMDGLLTCDFRKCGGWQGSGTCVSIFCGDCGGFGAIDDLIGAHYGNIQTDYSNTFHGQGRYPSESKAI